MRTASIFVSILPALFLVACGSDDDGDGSGTDAAVADADTTTPDADPSAPDAAVGLQCGDEVCDDTQECCVTGAGAGQTTCVEAETCQGTSFSCGNNQDCGEGELCCPVAAGGSECQMTASCSIPQCTTEADCPTQGHDCCLIGTTRVCALNCPGNN